MEKHPVIGITMGDPGGIGPEVTLKALQRRPANASFVLFGSQKVWLYHSGLLKIPFEQISATIVNIDNVPDPYFGARPETAGKASIEYLEKAFEDFDAGKLDAVVTGPIQKESWHRSGYDYAGQTEYCAKRTGSAEYCMLMAGEKLRIALLSTHLSLAEALRMVRQDAIVCRLRLVHREFVKLGFKNPSIACAALNPHAGEAGAFGKEELEEIEPALNQLRNEGIPIDGPFAPEVIFRRAVAERKWDVVFALYHDQAMIPLKLVDFEQSANVTLGLPLIRTSPDHGTAFDIAGQGIANPGSMITAIKLAFDWTLRRMSA